MIRSAWQAALTLFCVALLTFLLIRLVPGGPFDSDKVLPPEILASLNAKFRLDLPWYKQFTLYIWDIVSSGHFGPSIKYPGRTVEEIITESLPISLELGVYALMLAISTGLLLGIFAALNRGKFFDQALMGLAISGVSLPSFLVAALAIWFFSLKLGWFPAALWDSSAHKILPAVVLGLRPAAILARLTRSTILETLPQDFVRTARAKGLSPSKVVGIHVLRNSLLPVITVLGPMAATVLTGSFIVEYVFSVPGLASHYIQAVTNRDYPLILGVTLLYAAFLIAASLLSDWVASLLDPRMNSAGAKA